MSSDEGQICHSGAADVGVLRMVVLDVHQQQFVISKQFVAGFNWTPYTLNSGGLTIQTMSANRVTTCPVSEAFPFKIHGEVAELLEDDDEDDETGTG